LALNYIWIGFFLIAFLVSIIKFFFFGEVEIFNTIVNSTMDNARKAFETALFLTGIISLWLGILNIGERGGMIRIISRLVAPFFSKLFPEIPKDHPSIGAMVMNISANMLGLGNAATPLGLKAMEEMQKLNPQKDTASNAQIMFLVLNTSGLTIIPITAMALRAEYNAAHPSDIFIPIIITTFFSTMAGLISVSLIQKINLLNKTILIYLGTLTLIISSIIYYFYNLDKNDNNGQYAKISEC
jgi:spore maturation protein SpmA